MEEGIQSEELRFKSNFFIDNCEEPYSLDDYDEYLILRSGHLHHVDVVITPLYCVETFQVVYLVYLSSLSNYIVLGCGTASCHKEFYFVLNSYNPIFFLHFDSLLSRTKNIFELPKNTKNGCRCAYQGPGIHLSEISQLKMNVYIGVSIASLIGLLITALVYCIIPDFKNLHGKIVLSNIVSIAVPTGLVVLMFSHLSIRESIEASYIACSIIGFAFYFSFLSTSVWMTILGFDLGERAPPRGTPS